MVMSTTTAVMAAIPVAAMWPVAPVTLVIPPRPSQRKREGMLGSLPHAAVGCMVHLIGLDWRRLEDTRPAIIGVEANPSPEMVEAKA